MSKDSRPALIIVHGAPGAGKTTLARRLAKDLELPQIGKDDLKEFLFDRMGMGDREWSRTLGKAVSEMLYPLADAILASGRSVMLESAFHRVFAAPALRDIITKRSARCLEIYCDIDREERKRRFIQRNETGQRHPGHLDATTYDEVDSDAHDETYAPLEIGELHRIDTTHFGEPEYEALRQHVAAFLQQAD